MAPRQTISPPAGDHIVQNVQTDDMLPTDEYAQVLLQITLALRLHIEDNARSADALVMSTDYLCDESP